MTDEQFLAAFETGTLPNAAFHHRDHLRMAWLYVTRDGVAAGADHACQTLRQFAAAKGAAQFYHESLTRFWLRLVGHVTAVSPAAREFDAFIAGNGWLEDKNLPLRHYRQETLTGPAARAGWVAPDLAPLP